MTAAPRGDDQVTIVVPADVAAAVSARVDSGEYATPGDAVRAGMRMLAEEDQLLDDPDVEQWLRGVAVPIAEATIADPSRSIPVEDVRAHFVNKRVQRG